MMKQKLYKLNATKCQVMLYDQINIDDGDGCIRL